MKTSSIRIGFSVVIELAQISGATHNLNHDQTFSSPRSATLGALAAFAGVVVGEMLHGREPEVDYVVRNINLAM